MDPLNVAAKFEHRIAEIIAIDVLGGVANPQSWEQEAVVGRPVGDSTVRKSVGEFL